jgi:ferredoxin
VPTVACRTADRAWIDKLLNPTSSLNDKYFERQVVEPTELVCTDRAKEVMKVWIDQDLCTGDGLCEEIAPAVFTLLDDGLSYVKEGDKIFDQPGGQEGLAVVPDGMEDATRESAEECPGECIFIEE